MAPPLRLALAQLNAHVGHLDRNVQAIVGALAEARRSGATLVLFPELMISGYPPEDLLYKAGFLAAVRDAVISLLPHTQGLTAVVGFPELADDVYNSAAILHDGGLMGVHRKWFLPNYGVFDENRYFHAGHDAIVYQRPDVRFGAVICEDIWYPDGPARPMCLWGDAQLITAINASPFHLGKGAYRDHMLATRAVDYTTAIAYVNLVGGQDELVFDGRSALYGPTGERLASGPAFDEAVIVADLHLAEVDHARREAPRRRQEKLRQMPMPVGRIDLTPVRPETAVPTVSHNPQAESLSEEETAYKALVTGLRDYIEKNRFPGVVIGLSGGIDSALVATLAVDAVGPDRVRGVAMPGPYSAAISSEDAEILARNLGIRLDVVPIAEPFAAFKGALADVFIGQAENVAEENLQARSRGVILMAIANKFNWMVLTTGNKSEMAVGYATLYGDMAGGMAVIKDVPKLLVYRLCEYRNTLSPVIPERTITRPPSAELRPDQKDSDSLPPYEVLDPILKAYVEDDLSLPAIVEMGFDQATVERVIRLVDLAEYKRRQSAPGIKITERAFGRDRRLPITNAFRDMKGD
jgi:NAD+ synthase (glutamine-hydrolysing)